jgi:hypothetical protein
MCALGLAWLALAAGSVWGQQSGGGGAQAGTAPAAAAQAAGVGSGAGKSAAAGFRWLDAEKDAEEWRRIEGAFAAELKPESAQETMPYEPMAFKKVRRVAVAGDAALVLIEKALSENARSSVVSGYNYNLKTQQKSPIAMKWTMWDWKYYGTAQFEAGVTDIVFTFESCVGCDATSVLSSFAYQPSANLWKVRLWLGGDQGIYIGSRQETVKGVVLDDCIFGIQDFEHTGSDQVLDFCRKKEQSPDPPYHIFSVGYRADVFQVVDGKPVVRSSKNIEERKALLAEICKSQEGNELCGQGLNLNDNGKHKKGSQ